ncbi:hypothetical protein QFC22_005549 [Naganishia vaughanmartiniae]|uniref:Uncharacterized protein n=1 Tax=Naganishia vaughanmartiniae TaxID=1424756 RepID=A0ACC2WT54_9TREE|nr:hypothetical protein QFC22_005549 [Naganishia vaughanmartiniae]
MSAPPASSVYSNDDAQTLAPSEASLNRRWYTQIQQWTHRLPPDRDQDHHHEEDEGTVGGRRDSVHQGRRGRDEEGTEAGTVGPGHSISRRASREYMKEQIKVQESERRRESKAVASERVEVLPSTVTGQPKSTIRTERRTKSINNKLAEPSRAKTSLQQPPHGQHRHPTIILSLDENEVPQTPKPKRGRRPPTPYHPPSDLALSEVPEEEESVFTVHHEELIGREPSRSEKERDVVAPITTATITGSRSSVIATTTTARKRYPLPPPSVAQTQPVKQRSSSKAPRSSKSSRPATTITSATNSKNPAHPTRHTTPLESSTTIVLPITAGKSTTSTTDDASFPPLPPHHEEEMTVLPEDSISHVGVGIDRPLPPPPPMMRSRRSREKIRGRDKKRAADRGRRPESPATSSSDSITTESSRTGRSRQSSSSGSDMDSTLSASERGKSKPSYRRNARDSPSWSLPPPFPITRLPVNGARTIKRMSYEFPPPSDPRLLAGQPVPRLTSPPLPPPPLQTSYNLLRPLVASPSSQQLSPGMHLPMLINGGSNVPQLGPHNQQMLMCGNAHWLPAAVSAHHLHGPSSTYTSPITHAQQRYGGAAYPQYPDRLGGTSSPLPPMRRGSLGGVMPLPSMITGQQGRAQDRMTSRRPSRAASLPVQIQERLGGEKRFERQRVGTGGTPQLPGPNMKPRRAERGTSAAPVLSNPLAQARTPVQGVKNATLRAGGNIGVVQNGTGRANVAAPALRTRTSRTPRNAPMNLPAPVPRRGAGVVGSGVRRGAEIQGRASARPIVTGRAAGARTGVIGRAVGNAGGPGGNLRVAKAAAAGNGGGGWVQGLLPPYGRKT